MENIWFNNWDEILRIICVTPLAYIVMVFILRLSGKRTLSKMNAFDFVITIAIGSILATISLNQNIPFANGVTAILTFIGLQFVFTGLAVRVEAFRNLITSKPTLIFYQGDFLNQVMKKERITVEEIHSAVRHKGISTMDGIDMIILETTGDLAIIEKIIYHKKATIADAEINPQNN